MENTISTISRSPSSGDADGLAADELVLLIECDRVTAGSSRHRLINVDEVLIGRGAAREVERGRGRLTLRVPDGRISSTHASLRRDGAALIVHDAGAKNGVIVNGARIERHLLRDGDVIECGHTFFVYRVGRVRPADEPVDLDVGAANPSLPGLTTLNAPLAAQLRALAEVARNPIPVLVLGPTGTGKELVARAVQALSQRPGSFVAVNCGALPENLVEAELFGARRGAFTGATEDRPGLVRSSDKGTLFLDEIGDLPERAQATLLRTLQEREVLPVGTTRPVAVDLRLVAATHHDLGALVQKQQFRADLLARLSGFIVTLPPLRERLDDLGLLIAALVQRHVADGAAPTISVQAMRLLLRYGWPLNVRELEHSLRTALSLANGRIDVAHLPSAIRDPSSAAPADQVAPSPKRRLTPEEEARREHLRALLVEHEGNISGVARVLGKDRVQIRRWIRLYGL